MVRKGKKNSADDSKGRKLALTIIVGVFIAIMLITLVNLIVGYIYSSPEYDRFCKGSFEPYAKPLVGNTDTCAFNKDLNDLAQNCTEEGGNPVYEYDSDGCALSIKKCDFCSKEFEDTYKEYNRKTFFIFAAIGFVLIVLGLFIEVLLMQIILLPAGAFLVIEAAVKNFDDKLAVIIVLALLVIAAVYLALKRLR